MSKKLFYSEDQIALALLIVRIGIGIAFMVHGFPKLFMGGALGLSKGLAAAGIPGGVGAAYLAALAEFLGGMTLIAGVLFRPTTVVLAFTMLVALIFHLNHGDNFNTYSHALESGILFVSLTIAGPGKFSVDHRLFGTQREDSLSPEWGRRPIGQIPAEQAA